DISKACYPAQLHWIEAGDEDDGNCRRRCPCGQRRGAIRRDHVDLTADQVGCQRRQTIVLTLRPAILDCDVLSFKVAGAFQALAECARSDCISIGGCAVEKSDHRHRPLLRARRERPGDRHPANEPGELAPSHSITSAARASSVGGTVRPSVLAVCMLRTNSNLSDCTTGRSLGLSPLRMRAV